MTWTNHGTYWQIDHKLPISSFDVLVNDIPNWDEIKKCNSLENLQPLTVAENSAKSDKLPDGSLARYKKIT